MPTDRPIKQSAVLAYRKGKHGLKVMLVTSLYTGRWVLPKGHLKNGLSAHESAKLEAFEEAGIEGNVDRRSVGAYEYVKTEQKGAGRRKVEVFPMAVSCVRDEWPEKDQRRRKWMAIDDAAAAVDEKQLKELITQFRKDTNSC